MKTIYCIATRKTECHGHGDFSPVDKIIKDGAYNSGDFPPCFEDIEAATTYINGLKWNDDKMIVPMVLVEDGESF